MRIFTATLGTETNTFSPLPTGMGDFKETMLLRPGQHPEQCTEVTAPLWTLRQKARQANWEVIEGSCAFAMPAGITVAKVYEELRDEILEQLKSALPVDMVALGMHGAMVAQGYPDCEGDMLARIRTLVGDKVPIGVELDPHCHLTERMVACADVLICFKEYPHTDFRERAEELIDILSLTVEKAVHPCMSVFDCRMLASFPTTVAPMKDFVSEIKALEQSDDKLLSISIIHGFKWGDVPDAGAKVLVITDNHKAYGDKLAAELGRRLFKIGTATNSRFNTFEQGFDKVKDAGDWPVVMAECADNPGGGAPGDGTYLLREVVERHIEDVCFGPLYDPVAVQICFSAGEYAVLPLRIGGKLCDLSGEPLDVIATVTRLAESGSQTFAGTLLELGPAAAIRLGSIDVVLSSKRDQAYGPDLFTNLGIDPTKKKLIIVKSSQHFYDGFAPIAKVFIYTSGPGALGADVTLLPYKHLQRPVWPFVVAPLDIGGPPQ